MAVYIGGMGFFDDVVDFVEDVGEAVVGVAEDVGDVIDDIPGIKQLIEVTGDFAKTAVGEAVLRAIATTMTGGLAVYVGPQLASVAFAFPGLMKGDDFFKAWLQEFAWRVEKTASIVGPDVFQDVGAQIKKLFAQAYAELGPFVQNLANDSIEEIAARFGVSELVASGFRDLLRQQLSNEKFDPYTGKRITLKDRVAGQKISPRAKTMAVSVVAKPKSLAESIKSTSNFSLAKTMTSTVFANAVPPASSSKVAQPEAVRSVSAVASEESSFVPNALLGLGIAGSLGALYWWYRR